MIFFGRALHRRLHVSRTLPAVLLQEYKVIPVVAPGEGRKHLSLLNEP